MCRCWRKNVLIFCQKISTIKSYIFADRRWTTDKDNNLYAKIGFHLDKILKPDYGYYNSHIHGNKRIHKFALSKTNLIKKYGFGKILTEWEMAQKLGYDRIRDCGLFK